MRVVEVELLWMRRLFGRWPSHMVFHALTCGNLRQPSVTHLAPAIQCTGRDLPCNLKIMAPSHRQTSILTLNYSCRPTAVEPCSHTATGWCCKLLSCVDLGNDIHFSHSIYCTLQFDALAPASVP